MGSLLYTAYRGVQFEEGREGAYMADRDIGEILLKDMLIEELGPFCGVDAIKVIT